MALIDFLQQAETITGPKAPSGIETPLVSADSELARAKQTQELRVKREELQRRIDNLRAQKEQLEARKKEIKENSLSNTPEDKIVAIAKAKGIKDEDIDTWLRARQQRSAREISEGQRQELGRGAKAQEMANRDAAIQAIFEAKRELAEAKAEEKLANAEMKEAKGDAVAAAENKFETLKAQFEKIHGEKWEDIDRVAPKAPKAPKYGESAPAVVEESASVEVELKPEEIGALQINEPGLLEKFRSGSGISYDERLAIKGKAQDYIAAEARKRREEAEAEAKEKRKKAEAEAEEKEKKMAEAQKTRSDIVSKAKDGKFSNKTKRNMAVDYCDTFRDAGEVPPKLADAWKILFDEEMPIIK